MNGFCTAGYERRPRSCYRYVIGVAIAGICLLGIDRHESNAQTVNRVGGDALEIDNSFHDAATRESASRKARSVSRPVAGRVARLTGASNINEVYPDGYVPPQGRAAGDDGILIYQNTLGFRLFRPLRGRRVADDLSTLLGGSCAVSKVRVRVSGGVSGGSGVFRAEGSLYDGCPTEGGSEIPGTRWRYDDLADNAAITHELVIDYSDRGICSNGSTCQVSLQNCTDGTCSDGSACAVTFQNCADESVCVGSVCVGDAPEIPPTVWLRIRFDTDDAGILHGKPAQVGFSEDGIDRPLEHCTSNFGGWPEFPHASFWIAMFARAGCICDTDSDCDDGLFCNGAATCGQGGICDVGDPPCGIGELCNEATNACDCATDEYCGDREFCNGAEICGPDGTCRSGSPPCAPGEVCDEIADECLCDSDDDCDDEAFCNGEEVCREGGICVPVFEWDCNGNGMEDDCDLDVGTSEDCDGNLVPDECQADCNRNGMADACEVPPFGNGPDCDGNGVPDECQADCDQDGIPDICEVPPIGDAKDCNANGRPDDCEVLDKDCNRNAIPDDCELVENDCNRNGMPDDCDVLDTLAGSGFEFAFFVDPISGEATPFSGAGLKGSFRDVMGLAFDPNTNTLYGVERNSDQLITIDAATGTGTAVGPVGFRDVRDLAFDPNTSVLYGVNGGTDELITIDVATGAGTAVGPLEPCWAAGLAFDSNNSTLYATDCFSRLITIDVATGASTVVGSLGFRSAFALAFDSNTDTLYGTGLDNGYGLFRIDLATGLGAAVGPHGLFFSIGGLAFDPNSNVLFGTDYILDHLIRLDVATGAATFVGALGFSPVRGLAFDESTNTLYGAEAAGNHIITIDLATGEGTYLLFGGGGQYDVEALALDVNTRTLYFTTVRVTQNNTTTRFRAMDIATGQITVLSVSFSLDVRALAFDPNTNTLYGVNGATLIIIDVETGEHTSVGPIGFVAIEGLAFDSGTQTLYGSANNGRLLITIDPQTGIGKRVDWHQTSLFGLTFLPRGGIDCNASRVPDVCELGENDCNGNDRPDECEADLDFDGDGFLDECDACLDSDLAKLIVVEECSAGVPNELLDDGCTMNDVLTECAVGAHSHGELTACVVRHANVWRRQGLLSGKDVGRIAHCAGTSNERKPSKRIKDDRSRARR